MPFTQEELEAMEEQEEMAQALRDLEEAEMDRIMVPPSQGYGEHWYPEVGEERGGEA